MHHVVRPSASLIAALIFLTMLSVQAPAITLDDIAWENLGDNPVPTVVFTATFRNEATEDSEPVDGTINAQPFGAFLPNVSLICDFHVPSLPPGATFDVVCEIDIGELPPDPDRFDIAGNRINPPPGTPGIRTSCPLPDFWGGGVDVFWIGDGDVEVILHRGILPVCPGRGTSFIRVLMDCGVPDQVGWSFSELCPGWEADLLDDNYDPAPNPLPAGPFQGWIAVSTDAPIGEVCEFNMDLTCGDAIGLIEMTGEACDCDLQVPVEPSTWGRIKNLHR
jgi:hypothetical protein